jgi:hypothetical protein
MYVKPTAPRSIGGVFDDAVSMYRNFGPGVWLLAFALELTTAVPSLDWQVQLMPAVADSMQDPLAALQDPLAALHVPPTVWLLTLIAIPAYLIFYAGTCCQCQWVATAQEISTGAAVDWVLADCREPLGLSADCLHRSSRTALAAEVAGFYWAGTLSLAFIVLIVEVTRASRSRWPAAAGSQGSLVAGRTLISYNFVIAVVAYFAVLLVTGLVALGLGAGGSATLVVSQVLGVASGVLLALLYCAVDSACTTT